MTRVPEPDLDQQPQRAVAERCRAQRGGDLLGLYRALLHAPRVAEAWLGLGTAVRYESSLDDWIRELPICQIARRTDCEYEWRHHAPLAREGGITQRQLDCLPDWSAEAESFTEAQRRVLAYTDAVIDGRVTDEAVRELRADLGDQALVELTATAATYLATARFLLALDVDLDRPEP